MPNELSYRLVGTVLGVLVWFLAFLAPPASAQPAHQAKKGVVIAKAASRAVTLTGYSRSRRQMDIVSEEAGRCVKVTADVGDTIGADGIYALIDTTFIDIAIKSNRVEQRLLQSQMAYYAREVSRNQKLYRQKAAAQAVLDKYCQELDQAKLHLDALQLAAKNLREKRDRHTVRVPAGWRIIKRGVEPGEWVAAGQNVGKAADFNTLLVPFALTATEYAWLMQRKESLALLLPDAGSGGLQVRAWVERVSPAFDPETRKINVDLAIGEGVPEKRGGLRTELVMNLPDASAAVLVPRRAVEKRYEDCWLTRPNGERVHVVLLGTGPKHTYRVRSAEIAPGDAFKIP